MCYTPDLEKELILYYKESASTYFNKLSQFIKYTDELKEVCMEGALLYCKSKEHKYNPSLNNNPLPFFKALIKNYCISWSQSLLSYLDRNNTNHLYQVQRNKDFCDRLLGKSAREYKLKQLLDEKN
jgi:hypothetical protein